MDNQTNLIKKLLPEKMVIAFFYALESGCFQLVNELK